MNVLRRGAYSVVRKPIKSILLLLVVVVISSFFMAGLAGQSASVNVQDSTRQAVGATFRLELSEANRHTRLDEATEKIGEGKEGTYRGVTIKKFEDGAYGVLTDNSFETVIPEDAETIAKVKGIEEYNLITVATVVNPVNFKRIEDPDMDQSQDFGGVNLRGNRIMEMDMDVAAGKIKLIDGRMTTKEDKDVCVISKELVEIEKEVEAYKKENSLTDIEAEAKIILDKSTDFKERLIEAETQYTVIELVEQFLLKPENRFSLVPLNIGLSDRTVLEGLQKYNEALLERLKLLKTTQGNTPTLDIMNEQIDAMHDNMLATIRSLKSGFSHAKENLQEQGDYFMARIKGMPTQEREFVNIKRQQMIKQELFVFLLQKKEENALSMAVTTPKAEIVDKAYSLSKPVSPRPLKLLAFAMGIAIIGAGCYVKVKY